MIADRVLREHDETEQALRAAVGWKERMVVMRRQARKLVLPGFPRRTPFATAAEARAYLDEDPLTCLLCGKSYRYLFQHLTTTHEVSLDEYREAYALPWTAG